MNEPSGSPASNRHSTISREDQQYVRIVTYEFRGPAKLAQRTHTAFLESISVPAGYSVADAPGGVGFVPDESERGLSGG